MKVQVLPVTAVALNFVIQAWLQCRGGLQSHNQHSMGRVLTENELYFLAFSLARVEDTKSNRHLAGLSVSDLCCCCSRGLFCFQCVIIWVMLYVVFSATMDILWKRDILQYKVLTIH